MKINGNDRVVQLRACAAALVYRWQHCFAVLTVLSVTIRYVDALRPRFGLRGLFLAGTFRPRVSPRRDRINYYFEARERVVDLALYTLSLRFQELL